MSPWITALIGLLLGAAVSGAVLWLRLGNRLASQRERLAMLEEQRTQHVQELERLRSDSTDQIEQLRERVRTAENEATALKEKLAAKETQFEEQKQLLEEAKKNLITVFEATGAKLLQSNADRFMQQAEKSFEEKAKPIQELLAKQHEAVAQLEKKRETAYVRLDEQIKQIAQSHERLNTETGRLVTALRRPEQRGRWGEMQLRNVVELAGMTEHCDFHEQAQTDDPTTRDRPDMVVHLPGEGVIVVDSKVSLDAYLNSIEPDADRSAELQRHTRQVESHVRHLSSKAYWNQFERTPRLVVMFMPLESALHAALEVKPDLHAEAMKQHVLIATPTLLVATLRAIAYGWQQEEVAQNAKEIADVGRDLYDRLSTFTSHITKVGRGLDTANKSYNSAIGSLERMVLPGARRLKELGATIDKQFDGPEPIDIEVREITAPELKQLGDD